MIPIASIKSIFPQLFEKELLEEIKATGIVKSFPKESSILAPGAFIKSIPLLMQGIVKVMRHDEDENEVLLYYLQTGETCAISLTCCMSNARSTVSVEVVEDAEMIMIPIEKLESWMSNYPSWKSFIMQSYRLRFDKLLQVVDNIAFRKIDERLEAYLHQKAETQNTRTIGTTHQEIANELGTSREVISRLLKKMEQLGMVKLGRNKIQLLASHAKQKTP